ncbi:MAG: sulfatase [Bacteroidales bacterium]|nr:sulfatase [Bacteroidales bacterium]
MEKLSFLLIGCACISGCSSGKHEVTDGSKPNIIFILTDDHRWDAMSYAGNKIIRTPQMDRLASEGTWFKNAFVTTPISAASRASLLTGMYERTHGYTFQQGPLKEPYMQLSYPVILKQNGYYTGFFGKLGVTYKNAEMLFDTADIYDRNGNFPDRRGYFFKTIGADTVHLTRYTGFQAQEFIKDAPSDKPFCLSLSFSAPHAHDNAPEQYIWQKKSDELYSDITIPDPLLGEDKYFMALPKEAREGYNRLRWTWRFDTPEKYQKSIKGYYRMITEIDDEIGELRKVLEDKGIAENTIIILMGDNGYFLAERQLADKWLMYDNSLHVPLIIFDPRAKKHGDISDMVLNIDIAKTILDIAAVEIPEEYQGISLMPYVWNKKPEKVREEILFEHLWKLPEIPSSEGIRTNEWKYFRYRFIEAPEELYDLKNDPLETKNLAPDPAYNEILSRLRKECDNQIEKYTKAKLVSDYTPPEEIDKSF